MKVYLSRHSWYCWFQYHIWNSIDSMINQYWIQNLCELELWEWEKIIERSVYSFIYDVKNNKRTTYHKYWDSSISTFTFIIKEWEDFDGYDYDTMKRKSEELLARLKKVPEKAKLIKKTKEAIKWLQKQLEELEKE